MTGQSNSDAQFKTAETRDFVAVVPFLRLALFVCACWAGLVFLIYLSFELLIDGWASFAPLVGLGGI